MTSWAETCSLCGNETLWWTNRLAYKVCMRCAADPLAALEVLARRVPGGVQRVRSWGILDPQEGSCDIT
jgi:hypothetical protein